MYWGACLTQWLVKVLLPLVLLAACCAASSICHSIYQLSSVREVSLLQHNKRANDAVQVLESQPCLRLPQLLQRPPPVGC
jgi:hypothetical protein